MWGSHERAGNLIILGFLFCLGLYSIICSLIMPPAAYGEVGPGFFPKILGVLLCGISIVLGIQNFIKTNTTNRVEISYRKVWYIVPSIIVLAVLFEKVGFIPLVALLVCFLLRIFSNVGYKKCIAFSVILAIGAYLIFGSLLELQLPRGEWVMNLLRWVR